VPTLQGLPLAYVPNLFARGHRIRLQVFPPNAKRWRKNRHLSSLSSEQTKIWFQAFAQTGYPPNLRNPMGQRTSAFVENLSAHLWTTHQLDAFRMRPRLRRSLHALYIRNNQSSSTASPSIGQGVVSAEEPLFRKFAAPRRIFQQRQPEGGLDSLKAVADRGQEAPIPYGHWYVDGGEPCCP